MLLIIQLNNNIKSNSNNNLTNSNNNINQLSNPLADSNEFSVDTHATSPAPLVSGNNNPILSSNDPSVKKHKKENGFAHMFAGSIAGMASKTILQPLDLVKVRLQVQDGE
jgi:hypothetical protein